MNKTIFGYALVAVLLAGAAQASHTECQPGSGGSDISCGAYPREAGDPVLGWHHSSGPQNDVFLPGVDGIAKSADADDKGSDKDDADEKDDD